MAFRVDNVAGKRREIAQFHAGYSYLYTAKLLQKSEMRKDIVIELSYKGFG